MLKALLADMAIACGGGEVGVAEEMLDDGHLGIGFQEMSGEAVAKAMDASWAGELGSSESAVEEVLTGDLGHGQVPVQAGEEEGTFGLELAVVGAKNFEKRLGE